VNQQTEQALKGRKSLEAKQRDGVQSGQRVMIHPMPNNDPFFSRAIAGGHGWKRAEAAMSFTQACTVGNPIPATYSGTTVGVIEPGNVWDFAGVPTAST
jgi:hypothetical protein